MKKYAIAALTCVAVSLGGCAADRQQVVVKANQSTVVGFMATMSVGCEDHAPPRPVMATPPQSGKVTFGVGKTQFNNKQSACNGTPMTGAYTNYMPNKGFRGQDRFTVRYDYDSNDGGGTANRAVEYVIDVK